MPWKVQIFTMIPMQPALPFTWGTGLDAPLLELARREQRPPDEVAADLLSDALQQRQLDAENTRLWRNLTRREQEVAALICLNYTSDEIALRLGAFPRNGQDPRPPHPGQVRPAQPGPPAPAPARLGFLRLGRAGRVILLHHGATVGQPQSTETKTNLMCLHAIWTDPTG